jgi:hypothetical protein
MIPQMEETKATLPYLHTLTDIISLRHIEVVRKNADKFFRVTTTAIGARYPARNQLAFTEQQQQKNARNEHKCCGYERINHEL